MLLLISKSELYVINCNLKDKIIHTITVKSNRKKLICRNELKMFDVMKRKYR